MIRGLVRHGDLLIAPVPAVPPGAEPLPRLVLAEGEVTGHSHQINDRATATLFRHAGQLFLEVHHAGATVVHEEHAAVQLAPGSYRVWQQREYSPEAIRVVRD